MKKSQMLINYTEWKLKTMALQKRQKEIIEELQCYVVEKDIFSYSNDVTTLVFSLRNTEYAFQALVLLNEYMNIEGQNDAVLHLMIAYEDKF